MLWNRLALIIPLVLVIVVLVSVILIHGSTLHTGSRDVEVRVVESLVYPGNITCNFKLNNCHVLIDETKPRPRVETRTAIVTMLPNGTVIGTTTTIHTPLAVAGKIYGSVERLLPIIEYACSNGIHIIEFTKLREVNVSKILLVIKEYQSPISRDLVSHIHDVSGKLYVELVNGSKIPMLETIVYSVNVDHGGYIIMRHDRGSVVKIVLTLSYKDGFIKQYGIEFARLRIEYICLDNNCTITIPS